MLIRRLDHNRFDVFIGNGWDNWTRVRRHHWGVTVVAGKRIPRETIRELNERLVK
jgi:hypothetical protein